MKTVIVYASRHHGNTKKLVEAIAKAHAVDVIDADLQQTADLKNYDRIGFASGVAFGKYYPPLLTFMEKNLPAGKKSNMSAPFCSFTKGRKKEYNLNNRHRKYTVRQDRNAQYQLMQGDCHIWRVSCIGSRNGDLP